MNPPRKARGTNKATEDESETPTDAVELLKNDHREVEQLFERCKKADGNEKEKLVREIASALFTHTIIEEEIFYPACREKGVDTGPMDEAQVEHDTVKLMVEELLESDADDDEYYDAKIKVLSEYVKHHVTEEEKEDEGIFSRAKTAGLDMNEIGGKLKTRKREVKRREDRNPSCPEIKSLNTQQQQESSQMGRQDNDWEGRSGYYGSERDESGRGGYNRSQGYGRYQGSGRDQDEYRGYRGSSGIGSGSGGSRYYGGDSQPRRQAGDNDIRSGSGYGGYGRGRSSNFSGGREYGSDYYEESGREGGRGGRGYSSARRDIYGSSGSSGDYDDDEYREDSRYGRNYGQDQDDNGYGNRRGWDR